MASAQSYPDHVIKLIMPFTPGSPVDAAGRVIGQAVQSRLGQSIIIENRPGGGTTLGIKTAMAVFRPDLYDAALGNKAPTEAPAAFGAFAGPAFDPADIRGHLEAFGVARWKA